MGNLWRGGPRPKCENHETLIHRCANTKLPRSITRDLTPHPHALKAGTNGAQYSVKLISIVIAFRMIVCQLFSQYVSDTTS